MRNLFGFGAEKPLTFPLPEVLSCSAVVFTRPSAVQQNGQQIKRAAQRWIADNVPGPLKDLVTRFLLLPNLEIYGVPNGKVAEDTIASVKRYGITDAEYAAIAAAPFVYYIQGSDMPRHPRAATWAVLCAAIAISQSDGAVMVDLDGVSLWDFQKPFAALQWNGLMRAGEFVRTPIVPDDRGSFVVRTAGMARFALPDIQIRSVPKAIAPDLIRPLLGLAQQLAGLVMAQTGNSPTRLATIEIPREVGIANGSVVVACGEDPDAATESITDFPVRLSVGADADSPSQSVLIVESPKGARTKHVEWLHVLAEHFESVTIAPAQHAELLPPSPTAI